MREREKTIRDPICRPSGPKGGSLSLLSCEHTQGDFMQTDGNSTDTGHSEHDDQADLFEGHRRDNDEPRNLVPCTGRSVRYAVAILRYGGHV